MTKKAAASSRSATAASPAVSDVTPGALQPDASFDPSTGPITPDMTDAERAAVELAGAEGREVPVARVLLALVPGGTYNGGETHGPALEVPAHRFGSGDDVAETIDLDLVLNVQALYGGGPELHLAVKTSPTGGENSFVTVSDEVVVSEEGDTAVHVSGVKAYVRAEFWIDGSGPAIAFTLGEVYDAPVDEVPAPPVG